MWKKVLLLLAFAITSSHCVTAYRKSVGGNTNRTFERIYLTDFNTAWQAVLDSLKSQRIEISNREGGYVQTKWNDNTDDKNFADSFGATAAYLKAQNRYRIVVSKGFYNGKPTVKVSVQKEQLVQRDVLEGWKAIETDSIDENTLLYRIARIIYIRTKIAKLEEEKAKEELRKSEF